MKCDNAVQFQALARGILNATTLNWVAIKEFNLSYYIGETLLFTIYTHYGNCKR